MVDEQARSKVGQVINSIAKVFAKVFIDFVEVLVEVFILDFDWTRLMLFIAFLVPLAAGLFLTGEPVVRIFAGMVALLIAIYNFKRDRKIRERKTKFPLQGTEH